MALFAALTLMCLVEAASPSLVTDQEVRNHADPGMREAYVELAAKSATPPTGCVCARSAKVCEASAECTTANGQANFVCDSDVSGSLTDAPCPAASLAGQPFNRRTGAPFNGQSGNLNATDGWGDCEDVTDLAGNPWVDTAGNGCNQQGCQTDYVVSDAATLGVDALGVKADMACCLCGRGRFGGPLSSASRAQQDETALAKIIGQSAADAVGVTADVTHLNNADTGGNDQAFADGDSRNTVF